MKKIPLLVSLTTLACLVAVHSQDAPTTVVGQPSTPALAPVATARIIGTIPDGTPPPAQAPKPQFVARATDILDSKVYEQGGRTITIHEIKPIALPPPPMPQPESRTAQINNAAFKQRLADYRAAHPQSAVLSLGATVYRSQATPPRTLVQYWPERGGDPITFWSSADFSLIAGIHSFVATDGRTYSLFLAWGNIDTTRTAQAPKERTIRRISRSSLTALPPSASSARHLPIHPSLSPSSRSTTSTTRNSGV